MPIFRCAKLKVQRKVREIRISCVGHYVLTYRASQLIPIFSRMFDTRIYQSLLSTASAGASQERALELFFGWLKCAI